MNDLDDLLGELGGAPEDDLWSQIAAEVAPEPAFTPEARGAIDTNLSKRYTIMPSKAQMAALRTPQPAASSSKDDFKIAISPADIDFLKREEPLERLLENTSSQVNRFFDGLYQATNFAVKHDLQMKRRNADYMKKSTADLINDLKDKDLVVVERSAEALAAKTDDDADPRERELAAAELRKDKGIRIIIDRLNHSGKGAVQTSCVKILCAVSKDEENRKMLRHMGGIKPVVKLIKTADVDILLRIMTFVYNMSSDDKGSDAISRVGGIGYIIPFMAAQNPLLQMLGNKSILNLSGLSRNQEIMSKAGIINFVLKNMTSPNAGTRLTACRILENVAKSEHMQNNTPTAAIQVLLDICKAPHLCYNNAEVQHRNFPDNNGPKHGQDEDIQIASLNALTSLALNQVNKKVMLQLNAVRQLISYAKINGKVPYEVFKWNVEVTHSALRVLNNLVRESRENLKQLFESDGMNICLQLLTVEEFPKEFVLTVASILSHLSSDESFQREVGGNAVVFLIRILQNFSDNQVLQFIVIRTFRALASDDNNRQKIFEEGGIQILYNLLKSDNEEIVAEVCEAFVALAPNKFIRKVVRVLGLEKPVELLYSTNAAIIVPLLKVLTLVASDNEGLEPLMKANVMQGLVTQLYSKNPAIQEQVCHAVLKLISGEKEKVSLVESGGAKAMFEVVMSDNARVQFLSINVLTKLCQNPNIKAALQAEGMVELLKNLAQHKNLTGKEGKLMAEFKTLVITFKRTQTGANTIKIAHGDGAAAAAAGANLAPGITEKPYQEDSNVEAMLMRLSKPRLCSIINSMARETNTNIREFLTSYLSERKDGPGAAGGSATDSAQARMFSRSKAPGAPSAPNAPPPPPSGNRLLKPAPANARSALGGEGSMGGLLDELTKKGSNLRKVDASDHAAPLPTKDPLGRAIVRAGDLLKAKSGLKVTRKVLDQGLLEPSRTWESNLGKWNKDFQTACYYDLSLIKLVWELAESEDGVVNFKHAMELVEGFKTMEHLANTMLKLGFAVRRTRALTEEGEKVEWEQLVRPGDFPVPLILKGLMLVTDPAGLHQMKWDELHGK